MPGISECERRKHVMDQTGGAGHGRFHSRGFATRLTPVVETLHTEKIGSLAGHCDSGPAKPSGTGIAPLVTTAQ